MDIFWGFFGGIFWGSLGILSEFFENSLGVLGFLNMKGIWGLMQGRRKDKKFRFLEVREASSSHLKKGSILDLMNAL